MGKFPSKIDGFRCLMCDEIYEDDSEALDCCYDEKVEEGKWYRCHECEELHDDRYEAQVCCD